MRGALLTGLRSRGLGVLTAHEAGMLNKSDEEHLTFAASQNRTLYSFNLDHYVHLHTQWIESGRFHSGIITARQFFGRRADSPLGPNMRTAYAGRNAESNRVPGAVVIAQVAHAKRHL